MAIKYLFKVFNDKHELKSQVIVPVDHMIDTLEQLNKLGIVKGYVIFDQKESEEK